MGKLKIIIMKKIATFVFIVIYSFSYSQDQTSKKVQLGVSYSLTNNNEIFKNPLSFNVNYQVKKWNNLDLNVGIGAFYFISNVKETFSNKFSFNPNIGSTYNFNNSKFSSYIKLGYYYDNFKFNPTNFGLITNPNIDIKSNGIIITSGLMYFIQENIFIDSNLNLLFSTTKNASFYTESSNTFFNFGLGVAF
jgi:hypothetical protein